MARPSRLKAILAVAAVAALLGLVAGCGSSSSTSSISPAAYVKSICSAIGTFEKDVQRRSSTLDLRSISSASKGKEALVGFLGAITSQTQTTVAQLKAAGTPGVSNGQAIRDGIVKAFSQLESALSGAATQASSLPTDSPEAFKTAAEKLGRTVQQSMNGIGSSLAGLKSQELEKAAAADPTCRGLASS